MPGTLHTACHWVGTRNALVIRSRSITSIVATGSKAAVGSNTTVPPVSIIGARTPMPAM